MSKAIYILLVVSREVCYTYQSSFFVPFRLIPTESLGVNGVLIEAPDVPLNVFT